jgi:hypothetical protein
MKTMTNGNVIAMKPEPCEMSAACVILEKISYEVSPHSQPEFR